MIDEKKLITALVYVIAFLIGCFCTYKIVPQIAVERGGFYIGGEWLLPILLPLLVQLIELLLDTIKLIRKSEIN